MRHVSISASTALGDTAKTSIGVISMPKSAKRIVGFGGYAIGGPGNTTLENVTGVLEIEATVLHLSPQEFPLDCLALTGTGMAVLQPRIWPISVASPGNTDIEGFMTLDMAQTLANTGRWFIVWED